MKIRAYLDLCRVSNLPTVWTNVLAAVVLSGERVSLAVLLLLICSLSLFYSAGMCLNDICDVAGDRTKRPERPLPSGRISVRSASAVTSILFGAAVLLLAFVPHQRAVFAGLLLLAAIVLYDTTHKTHPLSVIVMAGCRFMVFAVSSIAVAGTMGLHTAIGGAVQLVYVLAVSIVARYEKGSAGRAGMTSRVSSVPYMISGISLLDGIVMALLVSPAWIAAGIAGMVMTLLGQRYVRGD